LESFHLSANWSKKFTVCEVAYYFFADKLIINITDVLRKNQYCGKRKLWCQDGEGTLKYLRGVGMGTGHTPWGWNEDGDKVQKSLLRR